MSSSLVNPFLYQPPPVDASDVYYNHNIALLDATGVQGAQNSTYVDSSPSSFTITTNGTPRQSTFNPYGTNWSYYFDGTGDYLTVPDNAAWAFGSADFTIEAWVFPTAAVQYRLFNQYASATSYFMVQVTAGGQVYVNHGASGSGIGYYSNAFLALNRWNHVAVVRSGNQFTTYINGRASGSQISTYSLPDYTSPVQIGASSVSTDFFKGYLSDYRIVPGESLYLSDFTPPTQPVVPVGNTILLTAQSNRIISDTVRLPVNSLPFIVTKVGDVRVTNFSPYEDTSFGGMYSVRFDGNGDYLQVNRSPIPSTSLYQVGTGNFTIECWVYLTTLQTVNTIYTGVPASTQEPSLVVLSNGTIRGGVGTTYVSSATGALVVNTWYHLALVRSSGNLVLYQNGVSVANGAAAANVQSTYSIIGGLTTNSSWSNGYISNLRYNSNAVYTGNFTVPTSPLEATSNTLLLTCHRSALVDSSTSNWPVQRVGDAVVSTVVPFQINDSVANTSVIETYNDWCTAFNGSSSYMQSGSSLAALNPGNQDFTIELWYYHKGSSNRQDLFNLQGTSFQRILLYYTGSALQYDSGVGSAAVSRISYSVTSATLYGKWVHIALCRSGGSTRLFLDGSQVGSTYADTQVWSSNMQFTTGRDPGGTTYVTGFISNIRYTIGTGLYTTAFNPPKAMTAVTGTVMHVLYDALPDTNGGTQYVALNKFNLVQKQSGPQGLTLNDANRTRRHSSLALQTGWSVRFGGVNYIQYAATQARYNLGTGDFTVEAWIMPTQVNSAADNHICGFRNGTAGTYYTMHLQSDGYLGWTDGGLTFQGPYIAVNRWSHVAVVRQSGTLRFFVDGKILSTFAYTRDLTAASVAAVGFNVGGKPGSVGERYFTGYISNVRVVKSAVYTANTTIATSDLTEISNTSILACQDQFANDRSSQAATRTIFATPAALSPILNTTTKDTSSYKGSLYLAGGADYLSMNSNSSLSPIGSGEYLWEAWLYPMTSTPARALWSSGQNVNCLGIGLNASNGIRLYRIASSGITLDYTATGSNMPIYQWSHIVVKKEGTLTMVWVNGVNTDTYSTSQTYTTPSSTLATVGRIPDRAEDFVGFISGMRFVQGAPAGLQYMYNSGAIAPPAYPPSANATNTKLMLYFNNAGLLDRSAMASGFELWGNTQITTSVSKFGGTSIAFDGNGDFIRLYGVAPAGSVDFEFGVSDFTIELWARFNAVDTTAVLVDFRSGAEGLHPTIYSVNGQLRYYTNSADRITSGNTFSTNTWYHIALVRYNGVTKLYVDGVAVGSPYTDTNAYASSILTYGIKGIGYATEAFNGYIDEPRVTRGVARYVANFTPPTAAFPRK